MAALTDDIDRLIGPPVEVNEEVLDACLEKDQFGSLFYALYKETVGLVRICGSVFQGHETSGIKLRRNQAVCVGLLVRVYKLMMSVLKLSSGVEHGEVVQALNRCIIESTINLRFLLSRNDSELYDRFIKASLSADIELYNQIQSNITGRGGKQFVIEQGMLQSIKRLCELSGVAVENVDLKAGAWGGSLKDKAEAVGIGPGYVALQRIPSHAVHGTWVDLVKNHLTPKGGGLEPNFEWTRTDGKLLSPIAILVIEAVREYLNTFFDHPSSDPLHRRLVSLEERLIRVESSRHDWEMLD